MGRHNNLPDGVEELASKAFTPSYMRNGPLIFAGCAAKRPKAKPTRPKAKKVTASMPPLEATEKNGDLLICDLCQNGTDSVNEMSVVNTDTKYHLTKTS